MIRSFCAAFLLALVVCPIALADDAEDAPKAKPRPARVAIQGTFAANVGATQPVSLARNKAVQQEIKLSDMQKETLDQAQAELQKTLQGIFAEVRNAEPANRSEIFKETAKKRQAAQAALNKKIEGMLEPEQMARLEQIALQRAGLRALTDQKVVKELRLAEEQQKQIADVQAKGRQRLTKLFQDVRDGALDRTKLQEKRQELNKQTEQETLDVLSQEQQAQFEKMKGEKFDWPRPTLRAVPLPAGGIKKLEIKPKKIELKKTDPKPRAVEKRV